MKINTHAQLDLQFTGTLLIPVFETHEKSLVPIEFHGVSVPAEVFYGKKDTSYLAHKYDSFHLFIGLGKDEGYAAIQTIFRRIVARHADILKGEVALVLPEGLSERQATAVFNGIVWGTYDLGHFKKPKSHPFSPDYTLEVIASKNFGHLAEKSFAAAYAQLEALRLVDLPPNVVTPSYLADWAEKTGAAFGFKTTVLDADTAREKGLDAFLSVAQGSAHPPRFIILEYIPDTITERTRHIGLVGKGITFDTGGLNIKTAGMVQMKSDMAGAAAVLATLRLVADRKLGARVTAIVPACENALGSGAFRPGDVIKSYGGSSIEVIDTDAEGRLILADGLSYLIKNYKPDTVIDIATLTGSSVATFGHECAALFTNDFELEMELRGAGETVGERLWPLPLWDAYKPDIESDIADVKNYHGKPIAGAITAAKFLEHFTEGHKSWAHLDIAGVAFVDDEFGKSKHATAYGVQLLATFIERRG